MRDIIDTYFAHFFEKNSNDKNHIYIMFQENSSLITSL